MLPLRKLLPCGIIKTGFLASILYARIGHIRTVTPRKSASFRGFNSVTAYSVNLVGNTTPSLRAMENRYGQTVSLSKPVGSSTDYRHIVLERAVSHQ